MQNIDLDIKHVYGTVSEAAVDALMPEAKAGLAHLVNADAAGNDFLGWLDLPSRTDEALTSDIEAAARSLRENCDVVEIGRAHV